MFLFISLSVCYCSVLQLQASKFQLQVFILLYTECWLQLIHFSLKRF